MLIGAQSVQAGLRRKQHLVECRVVVLADLVGIGDVKPDGIDIGRVVALLVVARQIAIRHQMEHADLHGAPRLRQCLDDATAAGGVMLRRERWPLNQSSRREYLNPFPQGERVARNAEPYEAGICQSALDSPRTTIRLTRLVNAAGSSGTSPSRILA